VSFRSWERGPWSLSYDPYYAPPAAEEEEDEEPPDEESSATDAPNGDSAPSSTRSGQP
jgi:hypothetical protein